MVWETRLHAASHNILIWVHSLQPATRRDVIKYHQICQQGTQINGVICEERKEIVLMAKLVQKRMLCYDVVVAARKEAAKLTVQRAGGLRVVVSVVVVLYVSF